MNNRVACRKGDWVLFSLLPSASENVLAFVAYECKGRVWSASNFNS